MVTRSEEILSIAKSRGFFYSTAEIYRPMAGFWTYGHLGKKLKNKYENLWKKYFLKLNPNFYEIEGSIVFKKDVFKGSGHLEHFNDVEIKCPKCSKKFKVDILEEQNNDLLTDHYTGEELNKMLIEEKIKFRCPDCKTKVKAAEIGKANLMFNLTVGRDEEAFLTPETAQNPFLCFKHEYKTLREKLPLGLAMIGKAFRNEISPRQGFFRLREFTQAELQIFFNPLKINEHENFDNVKGEKLYLHTDKRMEIPLSRAKKELELPEFYLYHMLKVQQFYLDVLKIPKEDFRLRGLSEKEKAFYNKYHFDVEVNLKALGGFKEVGGIHYRTDHDLEGHQKESKEKMTVVKDDHKFIPHVLELSFGVDRNIWMLLDTFYVREKERSLFSFPDVVSPFDLAIFPLVKKDEKLVSKSKELFEDLFDKFDLFYDESGSIGRRYRRQDEIGTLFCATIDSEGITLRHRDSMKQRRVKVQELKKILNNPEDFEKIGSAIK